MEHIGIKIFFTKKSHYAILNIKNEISRKFRGISINKENDAENQSIYWKLANNLLIGTSYDMKKLCHEEKRISRISNYLDTVNKDVPTIIPGYTLIQIKYFKYTNEDLPFLNLKCWKNRKKIKFKDYAPEFEHFNVHLFSDKRNKKPATLFTPLDILLHRLQDGDLIYVSSIFRISRKKRQLQAFFQALNSKNVQLISITERAHFIPNCQTSTNRFLETLFNTWPFENYFLSKIDIDFLQQYYSESYFSFSPFNIKILLRIVKHVNSQKAADDYQHKRKKRPFLPSIEHFLEVEWFIFKLINKRAFADPEAEAYDDAFPDHFGFYPATEYSDYTDKDPYLDYY
jgi:hypothetical protein